MLWSILGGWLLVIAYFACIQDYEQTLVRLVGEKTKFPITMLTFYSLHLSQTTPYGFPVVQILVDCAGTAGGSVLLAIITLGSFCCCVSANTANSRMMYSFARDGAMPKWLHWTAPNQLPLRSVWISCGVAYCLSLISLGTPIALFAFNSVGTIGLNTGEWDGMRRSEPVGPRSLNFELPFLHRQPTRSRSLSGLL